MKIALIISAIFACYAFFATSKMLPSWVHELNCKGYDKHAHALIFCVLQVVCVFVFQSIAPLSIATILAVIGVAIEFLQKFSGRSFCVMDIFSNMAGILIAVLFLHFLNLLK